MSKKIKQPTTPATSLLYPDSPLAMYVWHPESLADWTAGMVCVIATSAAEARELAAIEVYPYPVDRVRSVARAHAMVDADRAEFIAELSHEEPTVLLRGAVYVRGGS